MTPAPIDVRSLTSLFVGFSISCFNHSQQRFQFHFWFSLLCVILFSFSWMVRFGCELTEFRCHFWVVMMGFSFRGCCVVFDLLHCNSASISMVFVVRFWRGFSWGLVFRWIRSWLMGIFWCLGFLFLQQQEDEEMLVPHTDLPENNHQPMEGTALFFFRSTVERNPPLFGTAFTAV